MNPHDTLRLTIVQMCSTPSVEHNHERCCETMSAIAPGSTDLISFPENMWFLRPPGATDGPSLTGNESIFQDLQELAQEKQCAIHIGSFPERIAGSNKCYNTSCIIHPNGVHGPHYRKRHLFSLRSTQETLDENEYCSAGNDIVMDTVKGWKIGHSICYDVRFPEHYRTLATQGMDIAMIPAAFTQTTGPAHWEVLLRARAIENQCFVVAAAQCGVHTSGRASYGHSMIIDPWGRTLAQADDQPCAITATLHRSTLTEVRQTVPALANRRSCTQQ